MVNFKFLVAVFFLLSFLQTSAELDGAKINFNFSFGGEGGAKFKGVTFGLISTESTEASFSFNKSQSEFCCEREYTSENFFDMSEVESDKIVRNILDFDSDYNSLILPAPTSGQK